MSASFLFMYCIHFLCVMQVCSTFKLCPCAGVGVVLTFELIVYASPSLGYYQHQVNITVIAYFHTMAPVLPISDASGERCKVHTRFQ